MENRISPESSLWNPWHGCHKLSTGCRHCYVYRGDSKHGKDSSIITKTGQFNLPVRRKKDKTYKIPSGNLVYTCFTSDFLIEEADEWRIEAWKMMRERYDLHFLFITKRIDRSANVCLRIGGTGMIMLPFVAPWKIKTEWITVFLFIKQLL